MNTTEIKDLLENMHALVGDETGIHIDPVQLMQDPIVTNRLAVELLQQVDREAKPELVLAPAGVDSYFGYSVALAAWMRFGICEFQQKDHSLTASLDIKKKEKVIIVLDTFNLKRAQVYQAFVEAQGAKVVAILSLVGGDSSKLSLPCLSLL